jgi:hypothetical protein
MFTKPLPSNDREIHRQTNRPLWYDRTAQKPRRQTIILLLRIFFTAGTWSPNRYLAKIGGWEYTYRHTNWCEGFMKYSVEMGSNAMTYTPSFITTGPGIRKFMVGGEDIQTHRHKNTDRMQIAYAYFYFFQNKKSSWKVWDNPHYYKLKDLKKKDGAWSPCDSEAD